MNSTLQGSLKNSKLELEQCVWFINKHSEDCKHRSSHLVYIYPMQSYSAAGVATNGTTFTSEIKVTVVRPIKSDLEKSVYPLQNKPVPKFFFFFLNENVLFWRIPQPFICNAYSRKKLPGLLLYKLLETETKTSRAWLYSLMDIWNTSVLWWQLGRGREMLLLGFSWEMKTYCKSKRFSQGLPAHLPSKIWSRREGDVRDAVAKTGPSAYCTFSVQGTDKIQMRRAAWSPWLWAGSVCAGQAQSFSFWQKRRMLIDSQQSRTQCAAPARAEGPTALCQEVRPWGEGDACSYPHSFHSTHHNKPHSRALEEPEMCCLHRWTFVVILISSLSSSLLITGGPLPAKQPPTNV